jgi:hypothetical protein
MRLGALASMLTGAKSAIGSNGGLAMIAGLMTWLAVTITSE